MAERILPHGGGTPALLRLRMEKDGALAGSARPGSRAAA